MKAWSTQMGLLLLASVAAMAGFESDVGYTRLADELGPGVPTGAGVDVTQVEASTSSTSPVYTPSRAHLQFTGKTFTDVSGQSAADSSHATAVGVYFYGSSTSVAPDISVIDNYWADEWLYDDFLSPPVSGGKGPPLEETRRIQNHSWISTSFSNPATLENLLQRLDFAIARDGFTCVAGVNNGTSTTLPALLCQGYHGIAVGLSGGTHSAGTTTLDGTGRIKPDLVAPGTTLTSYATPRVASAAALLLETADGLGDSDATRPQCIKAMLMAGATKDDVPDWDRSAGTPLDERYGAGELNIYRSHHILTAGRRTPAPEAYAPVKGWNYLTLTSSDQPRYVFTVPEGYVLQRFSILATWHRTITDVQSGPAWTPSVQLSDLDLHLYRSHAFVPGDLVDLSTSRVDNVEHIFQPLLEAGDYMLELSADGPAECGLAWTGDLALLPTSLVSFLSPGGLIGIRADVTPELPYRVEAASTMTPVPDWTELFRGSSTSAILEYIDPDSAVHPQRVYRVGPAP